jgi:glycine betaine/proline transport system ATP-binding protein
MNPLNVLRGTALMTPEAHLARDRYGAILIDRNGRIRLELDASQRPLRITIDHVTGRFVPCYDDDTAVLAKSEIAVASAGFGMREAIQLKRRTAHPILLIDDEGGFVGCCGDEEIYRGLARRPGA